MTNENGKKRTAVLTVDMQNGVIGNAYKKDLVIANINILIERARANEVSVIWVQHSDENLKENTKENTNGWQLTSDLKHEAMNYRFKRNSEIRLKTLI